MLHIMRTVLPQPDNRCAYVVLNPSTPAPVTSALLDTALRPAPTTICSLRAIRRVGGRGVTVACDRILRASALITAAQTICAAVARHFATLELGWTLLDYQAVPSMFVRLFAAANARPASPDNCPFQAATSGTSRTFSVSQVRIRTRQSGDLQEWESWPSLHSR